MTITASFPQPDEPFITSWSGGKDACFALRQAMQKGARPVAIYTLLDAGGERTGAHGLLKEILAAQAERSDEKVTIDADQRLFPPAVYLREQLNLSTIRPFMLLSDISINA